LQGWNEDLPSEENSGWLDIIYNIWRNLMKFGFENSYLKEQLRCWRL